VATKTYENREIVLPGFVHDMLEAHLGDRVDVGPDALVFCAPEAGPLRYSNFRKSTWDKAVTKTASLPSRLTPHHLRHTCAALMIKSGSHPKAVQAHLGHSSSR
jgi:integrase